MSIDRPITAFISWAHTHSSWHPGRAQRWRQTILDLATALRQVGGIDADLDLWHTTDHQNWSTYGVSKVRDSDFILIAVSEAYRERWEETGSPDTGAGAAREANAIKAIFDTNRESFVRRVKVVLLPGAEIDDIPLELVASTERFRVDRFDLGGLRPLLRSLLGKPDVPKPLLGSVPALPPTYVAGIGLSAETAPATIASAGIGGDDSQRAPLLRRVQHIEAELNAREHGPAHLLPHEREALVEEREIINATLDAMRNAVAAAQAPQAAVMTAPVGDEVEQAITEAEEAISQAQAAMRRLPAIVQEALFQYARTTEPLTVGGAGDTYTIADARHNEELGYLSWVEDLEQAVTPRTANPRVAAAAEAVKRVRAVVFGGASWDSRARAAPWSQILLRNDYGIEDPEFELRPVWTELGFLDD